MRRLERSCVIPASVERTFSYFRDPHNLPHLTPPWLAFTVTHCPRDVIFAGCTIDYTIRWLGVPIGWTTKITDYEENVRFVDTQQRGPYARWWHEHRFAPMGEQTLMSDLIEYDLPFGPIGAIAHALVVRRQLQQILDYRAQAARLLFG